MRYVLTFLLLSPLIQIPSLHAQTIVQAVYANTEIYSFSVAPTTPGNANIINFNPEVAQYAMVTDNMSQTYTVAGCAPYVGPAQACIAYVCNGVGGVTTIYVNDVGGGSLGNEEETNFYEVSGLKSSNCLDTAAVTTGSDTVCTESSCTLSITPSVPQELAVSANMCVGDGESITAAPAGVYFPTPESGTNPQLAGGNPVAVLAYNTTATVSTNVGTTCNPDWDGILAAFEVAQAHSPTYTDLHDFNASAGDPYTFYESNLAQGRDGNFYAESNQGGTSGNGTVFKISPGGTPTIILSFDGTDGTNANGGMTLGTDGNLYGDTSNGGSSGNGITFKITSKGKETALHNFANDGDGANPANVLVRGTNVFYGTTNNSSAETIYQVASSGSLTTLHTFSNSDGQAGGQLFLASDGNIYGGMNQGGEYGYGTAFKMTPKGAYAVLHNFSNTDGNEAAPGMVEINPGKFYGTTELGGSNGAGVVYSLTSSGVFSVLHNFNSSTDGYQALTLMLATDGNAYGVAASGGSANCGTIFEVTAAGVFSVVHTFDNTHGCTPAGYLTQGTDGKLYGLATNGGANGNGVFYSLDLGLSPFATLMTTSGKEFSSVEILGQGFSESSVVEFGGVTATKITLTGSTYILATVPAGALTGAVTVTTGATTLTSAQTFSVLPTIKGFNPTSGPVGTPVRITGTALTQTTKVTFDGVAASNFTVNSDTQVTAYVPTGAKTGKITVTTAGGSAASSAKFTVN